MTDKKKVLEKIATLEQALARFGEVLDRQKTAGDDWDVFQDSAITRFKFSIEAFWKTLKKALDYEKMQTTSAREAIRAAFQIGIIDSEQMWLTMLDHRNELSHIYGLEAAQTIFEFLPGHYACMMSNLKKLKDRYEH